MRSALEVALGGVPFVDASFNDEVLLELVARKRRTLLASADDHLDPLAPAAGADALNAAPARSIQKRWAGLRALSVPYVEAVDEARARITTNEPVWQLLFRLPVRLLAATEGSSVVSSSNPFVPQTIALGDRAFASSRKLDESLIHEYAHIWLGLICELRDVQRPRAATTFVLPSGTRGKGVRTVLFAGHFAAACGKYFGRAAMMADTHLTFSDYAQGCVAMVESTGEWELTETGTFIVSRLKRAARQDPISG